MADPDLYRSQEESLLCSICLSDFTDPVTTPCGHNFCSSCFRLHFKTRSECPTCRRQFNKGLNLKVNTEFRSLVGSLQMLRVDEQQAGPGQVPCDLCSGAKLRAVKTCLDCLVSFCHKHPDPHWSHRLADPVEGLEKQRCRDHGKKLERFCWDDSQVLCRSCSGHHKHHVVPLEDEYRRMKVQMEQQKKEVKELLGLRAQKLQEMKAAEQKERQEMGRAVVSCVHALAHMTGVVQLGHARLLHELQEWEQALQRPAAAITAELQKEVGELERRSFRLDCLTNIEDPLQMLQSWTTFPTPAPAAGRVAHIRIHRPGADGVRKALDELEATLARELVRAGASFRTSCAKILAERPREPAPAVEDLDSVPEDVRMDVIRQQHQVDVSMDPGTASGPLLMSPCGKEVETCHVWLVDGRAVTFASYAYVLGKTALPPGRAYFEVAARLKTGWDVGVARASLGKVPSFTPSVRRGTWVLRLRGATKLQALEDRPVSLPLPCSLDRVGVFVDQDRGQVSFYDAGTAHLIYTFDGCQFGEPLVPFLSPGPSEGGVNDAPLVLAGPYTGPKGEPEPEGEEPAPGAADPRESLLSCAATVVVVLFIALLRQLFGV